MNILNQQPAEKPVWREDGTLEVHSIFRTIQGEGPLAGMPAVFIRLAGCNLQCPGCDTEYTKTRTLLSPQDLAAEAILTAGLSTDVIVITGGEPLRQNLGPAIEALQEDFAYVQIETNGTLYQEFNDSVMVVVSPKSPSIHPKWTRENVTAMKYVVESGCVDNDGFPNRVLGLNMKVARPPEGFKPECIYIQPFDEGDHIRDDAWSDQPTAQAVAVCLEHGYRLCLQVHKIVNLP